jgi:uncharacterized protein (TIRG00374 family)
MSAPLPKNSQFTPDSDREPAGSFTLSRSLRSLLLFAVAGAVLYTAATAASNPKTVLTALARFPVGILVLVLVLVVCGWLIRAWRFHYYLGQVGDPVRLGYAVEVFLAGFALTGTPGKLGEAVKGVFLRDDHGISMSRVVGIVVVERLMDLWGILLLGSFSFLLFTEWRSAFLICAAVVIAAGLFLCMERVYRPVLERAAGIRPLSWVSQKVLTVLLTGRELMTPRIFLVGLVISAVAWGLESVSLYLILRGLDLPASLPEANFVYCFSTLLGALLMLPGGIGGTEAGMVGLLAVLGISYSEALPAVILIRGCTLWFAILVGALFMIKLLARAKRN